MGSVEVANANFVVETGDKIYSIGCDHGEAPTIRHSAIKNLARYDGALKYDIFGRPVNGRSGGGLFNSQGQLIGVCNAAAVEVDEGIFTALETVHGELAKTQLDRLFETAPEKAAPILVAAAPVDRKEIALAASTPSATRLTPSRKMIPIERNKQKPEEPVRLASSSPVRNVSFEQAVPNNSDREVIITVRSKSDPENSRTITISDPTPKLLDYLDGMQEDESRSLKFAQYRRRD